MLVFAAAGKTQTLVGIGENNISTFQTPTEMEMQPGENEICFGWKKLINFPVAFVYTFQLLFVAVLSEFHRRTALVLRKGTILEFSWRREKKLHFLQYTCWYLKLVIVENVDFSKMFIVFSVMYSTGNFPYFYRFLQRKIIVYLRVQEKENNIQRAFPLHWMFPHGSISAAFLKQVEIKRGGIKISPPFSPVHTREAHSLFTDFPS